LRKSRLSIIDAVRVLRLTSEPERVCLTHPGKTVLLLPLTLLATGFLFLRMPKVVFPRQDIGIVSGGSRGSGSSLAQTKERLERFSRVLLDDPAVSHVIAYLDTGEGSSHGMVFATLRDLSTGRASGAEVAARVVARMGKDIHAEYHAQAPGNIMMRVGSNSSGVSYILRSEDDRLLGPATRRLAKALRHRPEFRDVDPDVDPPGQGITLAIDRDTAARVGVTPQVIGNTLSDALGQTTASVVYTAHGQYNVVLTVENRFQQDPEILRQFWVSPSGGSASGSSASNTIRVVTSAAASTTASTSATAFRNQIANSLAGGANASTGSAVATGAETLVPLSVVARITPSLDPVAVTHIGYASSASLALELASGVSLSQVQTIIDQEWRSLHLPETINGELQSDEGDIGKSTHDSEILITAAILAVWITLGMLYESVWHPLTILSTIPSAGIGAVMALDLFGLPFSGMAVIAMLLLTGISLKNAILLVDFAIHAERERGMTPRDAIREACLLRLRPIVMTTFAAALGAVPLGIALIGGLLVSQAQTMFTTPALYLLVARLARREYGRNV
jgi:multidrug efflux pump